MYQTSCTERPVQGFSTPNVNISQTVTANIQTSDDDENSWRRRLSGAHL